jgi:hypothetical protein
MCICSAGQPVMPQFRPPPRIPPPVMNPSYGSAISMSVPHGGQAYAPPQHRLYCHSNTVDSPVPRCYLRMVVVWEHFPRLLLARRRSVARYQSNSLRPAPACHPRTRRHTHRQRHSNSRTSHTINRDRSNINSNSNSNTRSTIHTSSNRNTEGSSLRQRAASLALVMLRNIVYLFLLFR